MHILKGDVPTATPGRILGHEGVGVIDRVGAAGRAPSPKRSTSACPWMQSGPTRTSPIPSCTICPRTSRSRPTR
nr:alcohol dehydrogenase catalytic domain-containing protein [Rhodobacter sp. NTK016B]